MIALATMLMLAAFDPPGAAPPAASTALMEQLRLQCRDADAVLPTLSEGLDAEKAKDFAAAKANYEAVIANCGVSRASGPARVFRAQIAWREADYRGVSNWLAGVQRVGPARLNLMASMLAMSADRELGDTPAIGRERAQVAAGVDRALSARGQRLGDFTVNGALVTAYKVDLVQGAFRRLLVFTITSPEPLELPETVMLTDDLNTRAIAKQLGSGPVPYFVDGYTCLTHVTVKMLPMHGDQPPTYDEVKPLVVDYLTRHTWATQQVRPADRACAWPQFVAPGVTN